MVKYVFLLMALVGLSACERADMSDEVKGESVVNFAVKGDFTCEFFTRASTLDAVSMTDLWVFDFVGGECVQHIHKVSTDEDFAAPSMTLAYGAHHLYFVASRGENPTVDEDAKTIVWEKPKDTFWKDIPLNVDGSTSNVSVVLDRVVTKLKVTITDEVPEGTSTLNLTPHTWYGGMNYVTGAAACVLTDLVRSVDVPVSYVGTSGTLAVSIFGFSDSDEWSTDVAVNVKNSGGTTLGSATITDAPLKRNRSTEYQGRLFSSPGTVFTITAGDTWLDAEFLSW